MRNIIKSRVVAVLASTVALVTLGGVGGAVAGSLVTSHDIKDNTVRSVDVHNGSLRLADLNTYIQHRITQGGQVGPQGPQGLPGADGAAGPAGPQGVPGLSNVQAGADYSHTWAGDEGESLNTIVESCPTGQYAIGGGYSTWGGDKDLGGTNKAIQVTVSAPYFEGEYKPISDTDSNFRPTEWVVKGYNNGDTDQIVRAWVVCADAQ